MRPRLALPLVLLALVAMLGQAPAVVVLRSVHRAAQAISPATPNRLPAGKQSFGRRGVPLRAHVRPPVGRAGAYNTGR